MAVLGQLVVQVNADLRGLQRDLDKATSAIQRLNRGITHAGTMLTVGLTVPIGALGASVFSAAADMDSLKRALTTIAGSASAAEEQLARLTEAAKAPGLGFKEAIQGSVRLQAVGVNARLAERTLAGLGNAIALTGGGKVELDRVTVQLGQLAAKGKVLQQDLRPIIDAGPAIGQALLKAFGTIDSEKIQDLGLSSEQFLTKLAEGLEQLPKVTGGARNSIDNFTDALFRARAAIGEKLLPVLTPLLERVTDLLTKVESVNPEVVRWGIAIAAVAAAIGPLILIAGSLATAVTALAAAIGVGLLPLIAVGGPIVLALGALAVLFVRNKLEALSAASAIDRFKASIVSLDQAALSEGIRTRTVAMANMRSASERLAEQLATQRAHLDTLQRQAPIPFGDLFTSRPQHPTLGRRVDVFGRLRPGFLPTPEGFDSEEITRTQANITRTEGLLVGLGGEIGRVQKEFRALGSAYNDSIASASTTPPIVPPDAAKKVREVADQVDHLAQKFRDLAKAQIATADLLKRTGLPFLPNVPDIITPGPLPGRDAMALSGGGSKDFGALEGEAKSAGDALKNATSWMDRFGEGVKQAVSQFAPMNLALSAVNAVLAPLQPLVDALLVPFTIIGEILATLIVPVLRILFLPLKYLGIVVSYIGEVIAKVAGAIANAIGHLVRGIGRLVNKLPGSPGDPLVKAGQAMIDLGKEFKDAAKEMAARRKELEHLSFDDALDRVTNGLDRLTESLTNVPQLFDLAFRRIQASRGETFGGNITTGNANASAQSGASVVINFAPGSIQGGGGGEIANDVVRKIARALGLASDPEHREIGRAFRMVVV